MNLHVRGEYKDKGDRIDFNIPIITFIENNISFVYCPALDLTGYGNNDDEAQASFNEALDTFFKYTIHKKTFLSELERLGWKTSKKKIITAPSLIDMVNSNAYLADIFEKKQYQKQQRMVTLPAFA